MLHRQQLPDAEYKDLNRVFSIKICLLLWILCKANEVVFEKAIVEKKFGQKVGQWLCGRIWKGTAKTKFGKKITTLIELAKANTEQAKTSASHIRNDIQLFKKWEMPDYEMKFTTLPEEWKNAIHDVCIPFYENWFSKSGFKKTVFKIDATHINRNKLMQAYRSISHGVCGYCDGELGNVGTTLEANDCEHFFPKSKFPHLCLHPYNLFVACKGCNETWKIDKAPMGVADSSGLYGTYHPQFRPGVDTIKIEVKEEKRIYKITLSDDMVPERAKSLNTVLDLETRWTNDINERIRSKISVLISACIRTSSRHVGIDEEEIAAIIDDQIADRRDHIGKSIRTLREIALLEYQQANKLAELLLDCA